MTGAARAVGRSAVCLKSTKEQSKQSSTRANVDGQQASKSFNAPLRQARGLRGRKKGSVKEGGKVHFGFGLLRKPHHAAALVRLGRELDTDAR